MELTREQIITMSKCGNKGVCSSCFHNIECQLKTKDAIIINSLATALLAEMNKPKVWYGAPEWATKAVVNWSAPTRCWSVNKEYTREPPKSRIDEIAEEAEDRYKRGAIGAGSLTDIIKSAILKDREERD